jgi:UDP-3-O-acyl-N-acetylglucosamine deacetylase
VTVRIHPGEHGIAFRSADIRRLARPENVTDTRRSTRLGEVATVEHLMSAFAGLEVTDAEVEVEGGELPGLDGSALAWVLGIHAAGFADLPSVERPPLFKRVFLVEGEAKIAISHGNGHWRYEFAGSERFPTDMVAESPDIVHDYTAQIAPARTFAFEDELPHLSALGLGQGLSEESAFVLTPTGMRGAQRVPQEPAAHKLLDFIGDIYLAGVPIRMLNAVAERSGHRANVDAAMKLRQVLQDKD